MTTFTWSVSIDASMEVAPRVRKATFGDGYVQRVADGINASPRSWSVRVPGLTQTVGDTVDAFLRARAGVESFDWTDPNGDTGKWVCEKWTRNVLGGGITSISATFVEVFGE